MYGSMIDNAPLWWHCAFRHYWTGKLRCIQTANNTLRGSARVANASRATHLNLNLIQLLVLRTLVLVTLVRAVSRLQTLRLQTFASVYGLCGLRKQPAHNYPTISISSWSICWHLGRSSSRSFACGPSSDPRSWADIPSVSRTSVSPSSASSS